MEDEGGGVRTDAREHWEKVHREKDPAQVSWRQARPERSLALIERAASCLAPPVRVVDAGGGSGTLVDELLERERYEVCVVDVAQAALDRSRARLRGEANSVRWLAANLADDLPALADRWADVWHDRAAFHFLTSQAERAAYTANVARIVKPGGVAIVSGFAPDGPERCSGLDVRRHDGASILREFTAGGPLWTLELEEREDHMTPWGSTQKFVYAFLRRA